jgi:hypothetical protein
MNKPDGFDCPGCAWPDMEHTSTFQFCENGAKSVTWEATSKRVTPEFFADHTVTELLDWSDFRLESEGRLSHPLAYDAGSDAYQPIGWDDAFARIGESLRSLPDPNMAEFYTSGRASNEEAFLFQIFARELWQQQFSRLLEHVSRGDQRRPASLHRHWQGHGIPGRFRSLRADHRHGPQSGHQSSAHDGELARGPPAGACRSSSSIRSANARWSVSPIRRI